MTGAAEDGRWMEAALAFGRRGLGTTAPNPCVAALVIADGVVVGRGVTAPGGRPHAEPIALAEAGARARGATLYVTLEPCCHVGRGRPCVEAIVAAGVSRVVVACGDPDPRVAGRGLAALRAAGIAVTTGIAAAAATLAHAGHICRVRDGRPALTLKLAETADGFAAAPPGAPRLMITGPIANGWTHVARAMHDAIVIGAGTARADDPHLTVRLPGMTDRRPLRIVLDAQARLEPASGLAGSARESPLLVVTGPAADPARRAALAAAGAKLVVSPVDRDGRLDLAPALRLLGERGLTRLFCEGGPQLAKALFAADLVDDFALFTATVRRAGAGRAALKPDTRERVTDPARFRLAEDRRLGDDRLRRYERLLPCSPD